MRCRSSSSDSTVKINITKKLIGLIVSSLIKSKGIQSPISSLMIPTKYSRTTKTSLKEALENCDAVLLTKHFLLLKL